MQQKTWFNAQKIKIKAYLFLLVSSILFAGNLIAGKVITSDIPSIGLSTLRSILGLLILTPLAWSQIKRTPPPNKREILQLCVIGFLGITMAYATFLTGIKYSSATNASIIIATYPVVTNTILYCWYKQRPTFAQISGLILSFSGLLIVFTQGDPAQLLTFNLGVGEGLFFLNVIVISLFNVMSQSFMKKFSSIVTSLYALAFGSIFLIPLGAWELITYDWHLSLTGWLIVIYMGVIVTGFAFYLNLYGIDKIGSGPASIFSNLQPVLSILLSVIILEEVLALYHYLGFILVLAGIILSLSNPVQPQKSNQSLNEVIPAQTMNSSLSTGK